MSPRRDEMAGRARAIRLLLSDVDGVLTDSGVYYTDGGELLKRFSLRDGMGVERLREIAGIETGLVTGERSPAVGKRAEKLRIAELHMGARDKERVLEEILRRRGLAAREVAYIGDDMNDIAVIRRVGLSACPGDAVPQVRQAVHIVCESPGGHGAFREFAEILIAAREEEKE
jgi:3-deoxy-D-manno-octulosonate 8-phosphate phosphatase (KDO 8-P phosphatase)